MWEEKEGGEIMVDKEYVRARNKLIPEAERFANQKAGRHYWGKTAPGWADKWNKAFHSKMEILARSLVAAGRKAKSKKIKGRV